MGIYHLTVSDKHIPGYYTHLCQPMDVRVNHPIKIEVIKQWEDLMTEDVGVDAEI
jgi:hypothetical protein